MTNVNANNNNNQVISLYKFSQEVGVRYQYFNQMINNEKFPNDLLIIDGTGKRFINREDGMAWWETVLAKREERAEAAQTKGHSTKSNENLIATPEQLLGCLIDLFDKAGKKDLSDALRKVQEEANKTDEQ